MKFIVLALATLSFSTSAFAQSAPAATKCFGTEPFWSLDLSGNTIRFERYGEPGNMTIPKTTPNQAQGLSADYIALYQGRLLEDKSRFMNVIITRETCSDGMGEEEAPYSVFVLSGSTLFKGCCRK